MLSTLIASLVIAQPTPDAGSWQWTEFPLHPDARVIYVDADAPEGGDGSLEHPFNTPQEGVILARAGFGDHILLERGDTFQPGDRLIINKDGREGYPTVFGAYGEGPRPIILGNPGRETVSISAAARKHIAMVGIHLKAQGDTPYEGLRIVNDTGHHIWVEDCLIEGFRDNIIAISREDTHDVFIRGNIIIDSASPLGGHSQGLFAQGIDDLVIEGNLFDHNGWRADGTADPTTRNHNCYVLGFSKDPLHRVVIRNNVFARGSSFGCTVSSNGTGGVIDPVIEDNLFVGNANGFVHGAEHPGAIVNTTIRRNSFVGHGRVIDGNPQVIGIEINHATGIVSDNYLGASSFSAGHRPYRELRGVNDVTLQGNTHGTWGSGPWDAAPAGWTHVGDRLLTMAADDIRAAYLARAPGGWDESISGKVLSAMLHTDRTEPPDDPEAQWRAEVADMMRALADEVEAGREGGS